MTREEFDRTLEQLRHRTPPEPFVIERTDGTAIEIDDPQALVFEGGVAGFLSSTDELLEFRCEEVRAIRELTGKPSP